MIITPSLLFLLLFKCASTLKFPLLPPASGHHALRSLLGSTCCGVRTLYTGRWNECAKSCGADGFMRFGVQSDVVPFSYRRIAGNYAGVYVELWKSVAREVGCLGIKFQPYKALVTNGSVVADGLIESLAIVSTILPINVLSKDPIRYATSLPTEHTTIVFLEASATNRGETTSIAHYTIFAPLVGTLITGSFVLIALLEKCHQSFRKSRVARKKAIPRAAKECFDVCHKLTFALTAFPTFIIILYWQGRFSGNTLLGVPLQGSTFTRMVFEFKAGEREAVMARGETVLPDEKAVNTVFGNLNNIILTDSVGERFAETCSCVGRVGVFTNTDVYSFFQNEQLAKNCFLRPIVMADAETTGFEYLDAAMKKGAPSAFLLARTNYSRAVLKAVNKLRFSVYPTDPASLVRYMPDKLFKTSMQNRDKDEAGGLQSKNITLVGVIYPLYLLGAGAVAGLVVLVFEVAVFVRRNRRCRISCVVPKCNRRR